MSFIISEKQYLATTEKRSNYRPLVCNGPGFKTQVIDVNFGHPLYSSVCDIYAVECTGEEPLNIPIIPDGCVSMSFVGKTESMKGYLCGAIDEIKKVVLEPGEIFLTFRFQASAVSGIIDDNASILTNKVIDLKECIKNGSHIVSAANRDMELQHKALLLSKLIRIRMKDDQSNYLIRYCTDRIFEKQGNIKISELGVETGYSERYLGKVFEKYVGVSPKMYCEIMRLQSSLKKLVNGSKQEPLINLALDSGFFDHAHMNRCYKRFLHCSSGILRKQGFDCLDFDSMDYYLI
jgi:AraC-like DNA-binding protein